MINNKIGGRNMVGRAVNRLAGRLTAVALTAAMAVSMLAGCAAGGKNTETAAKKEYKPSAMEQMNAKNDPNVIQDNYRTCYEVFVYSFFDSDGDGIGDLQGVLDKLDYLFMTAHSANETARHADLVLPGVTYAEKFGTMINVTGRIQRLNRAIQPIGYARDDWQIFRDITLLLGGNPALKDFNSALDILTAMSTEYLSLIHI